jgi:hypothetical protein
MQQDQKSDVDEQWINARQLHLNKRVVYVEL